MTVRRSVERRRSLVVLIEGGRSTLFGRRATCLRYVRSGGQGREEGGEVRIAWCDLGRLSGADRSLHSSVFDHGERHSGPFERRTILLNRKG